MTSLLLIEDDRRFANGFAEIAARMCGVEVAIVPGLEEALHLLQTQHFDVIALDLTLDDTTPKGTIAAIRDLSRKAPVVVVTGATGDKAGLLRNLAMFNGAAAFIQKDHLGLGGAWPLAMSVILDAYLRERSKRIRQEAA